MRLAGYLEQLGIDRRMVEDNVNCGSGHELLKHVGD